MKKSTFLHSIGEHTAALAEVVRKSVSTYPKAYSDNADIHSKRSQSSLIHDHMVRLAAQLLPRPDFQPVRVGQRNLISYRDECLLQFKKLRRNLTASNYPTKQAEMFEEVGAVQCLPGMSGDLPLITVGYVPKPFIVDCEAIFIVHIVNKTPSWVHRIDDDQPDAPILSILKPHDPIPTAKSRIKRADGGQSAAGSSA